MKEDKFNILVYGIEVFLNEAIKVVVIVCLGILMDKLRLIIFSMIFLLILRRYVGGNHFSNNKICLLYSVTSTTIIPVLVEKIEIIVLFIFVERRKNESEKQLLIRKSTGSWHSSEWIEWWLWNHLTRRLFVCRTSTRLSMCGKYSECTRTICVRWSCCARTRSCAA